MKVDLTDRFIAALKPHDKDLDYFRTLGPWALNLKVTPKGVKSWSVLFTSPKNGKRARLSIGTYPATPLATARTRAIEAHGHVESGVRPRALAKPNTGAMTVAMLINSYLKLHANKLRTFDELRGKLNTHVLPIIGNVTLTDLHRRDVHRVPRPHQRAPFARDGDEDFHGRRPCSIGQLSAAISTTTPVLVCVREERPSRVKGSCRRRRLRCCGLHSPPSSLTLNGP